MIGLLALAAVASANGQGQPLLIKDGGFCAGISWIVVKEPQGYTVDQGPDFSVYHYDGPNGVYWSVYSGGFAQISGSQGKILFQRQGVKVRSAVVDGKFHGYLATNWAGGQNHFLVRFLLTQKVI